MLKAMETMTCDELDQTLYLAGAEAIGTMMNGPDSALLELRQ